VGQKFSQRHGYTAVRTDIQTDGIDDPLRVCLWSACQFCYFGPRRWDDSEDASYAKHVRDELQLLVWEYVSDFHYGSNIPPSSYTKFLDNIRRFYFTREWYETYDFIEFLVTCERDVAEASRGWKEGCEYYETSQKFKGMCNKCLEKHLSAWRFVGKSISPVTTEEEIASIECALQSPDPFGPVGHHIDTGLVRLSDRESPDYRNSIKESISAVEACCRIVTGKKDLSGALAQIKDLHGALKKAFATLYGYTSDAERIRHALMDEPNLLQADAKFMLVACSAFVNYLIERTA
jgi:hypothetical protein